MKPSTTRARALAGWGGAVLCWIGVWQLAYWWIDQDLLLASPGATFLRLAQLLAQGETWGILFGSFCKISAGFLLGMGVGVLLGILTAFFAPARRLVQLPMAIIQAAPVASFVILALVWIRGTNLSIFIAFLMVMPMIWTSVHQGILSADPLLLEAAHAYRLSRWTVARVLYLPAVLPYLLSACRVAMGFAWKAGIAGEVIAIPQGAIGTQLYDAKVRLETVDLFAWTAIVVILSVVIEKLLTRGLERLARRGSRERRKTGDPVRP